MKWVLIFVLVLGIPVAYAARILGWPANAQPVVLQVRTCGTDTTEPAIFILVYVDGQTRTITVECTEGNAVNVKVGSDK